MWLYTIGAVLAVLAALSIKRTRSLYEKYDAKLAELNKRTEDGYLPKAEVEQIINEEMENFRDENIDFIMYAQMIEGIKNGALEVVGYEDIVILHVDEYKRLDDCDKLIQDMNSVKKKADIIN